MTLKLLTKSSTRHSEMVRSFTRNVSRRPRIGEKKWHNENWGSSTMKFAGSCLCHHFRYHFNIASSRKFTSYHFLLGVNRLCKRWRIVLTCYSSEPHICMSHGNYGAQTNSISAQRRFSLWTVRFDIWHQKINSFLWASNTQHLLDVSNSIDPV